MIAFVTAIVLYLVVGITLLVATLKVVSIKGSKELKSNIMEAMEEEGARIVLAWALLWPVLSLFVWLVLVCSYLSIFTKIRNTWDRVLQWIFK